MDFGVLQNQAHTFRLRPTSLWSSPSAEVLSPAGASLATPTATVDTVSTTIAAGATELFTFDLDDETGVDVGNHYLVELAGEDYVVQVTELDGATVEINPALPSVPPSGTTFRGIDITVTVPSSSTAELGHNYSLVVTEANKELRVVFDVVRHKLLCPVDAIDVHRWAQHHWPSYELSGQAVEEVLETILNETRDRFLAKGKYAQLYLNPNAMRPLGRALMKMVLASEHGLVPPDRDRKDYIDEQDREAERRVAMVWRSFQPADLDNDGVPDIPKTTVFGVRRSL